MSQLEYSESADYTFEEDEDADVVFHESPTVEVDDTEILDSADLMRELGSQLFQTMDLLNLSSSAACKVLRHFNWNADDLRDKYFEDEGILRRLGLQVGQDPDPLEKVTGRGISCPLCLLEPEEGHAMWKLKQCGHVLCEECWGDFLRAEVAKGITCVNSSCPVAISHTKLSINGCQTFVGEDVFKRFLSSAEYDRYKQFVLKSFVEDNRHCRWCPAPGCTKAIRSSDTSKQIVKCSCGFQFCFQCGDEAHAPASCKELKVWKEREAGESDNLMWITANTRPCPGCARATERIEGCNHMQWCPCKHHWCWVCGGMWDKTHEGRYYNCPRENDNHVKQKAWLRTSAKSELSLYVEYYEKYSNHQRLRKYNSAQDSANGEKHASDLAQYNPGINTKFITDAVQALLDARAYLKYCYVYGYNLAEGGNAAHHSLFMQHVNTLEDDVGRLNSILEANWRHKFTHGANDVPYSRDAIVERTHSVQKHLQDCQSGLSEFISTAGVAVGAASGRSPTPVAMDTS